MAASKPRSKMAREDLGFTESMMVKMHPDLLAHIRKQAELNYCSQAEYVRKLIIADMKLNP